MCGRVRNRARGRRRNCLVTGLSEAAVAQSVVVAAVPERVGLARAFAVATLGESHPGNDLAVLLASELATNSV
jgi:hypothetical protein